MDIQKAIKTLNSLVFCGSCTTGPCKDCDRKNAKDTAIQGLKELEQYRQIGTADECRAAREKMKPKKVTHEAPMKWCYTCPNCKDMLEHYIMCENKRVRVPDSHCPNCGQALDWTGSEGD